MRHATSRIDPLNLSWGFLAIIALVIALPASAQPPAAANGLLTDLAELQGLPDRIDQGDPSLVRARDAIASLADDLLEEPIVPITAGKQDGKRVAPNGDPREYVSLSPYWWPNPDTDDGLPYIRRDGRVNPERYEYDTPKLGAFGSAVRLLGFAYMATGDERYAAKAAEHLRVWMIDPETRMNPRLAYSQFIPGVSDGRAVGIIDTNRLRWVADAVLMLEGSDSWSRRETDAVRAWYGDYVDWLLTSDLGAQERAAKNNHGTWFHAQAMQYALFAGRESIVRELAEETKGLIASQIEPNGTQPHELTRTRSLHYHDFNLRGFMDAAHYARAVGIDLANYEAPNGASLRTTLEFILPYLVNPEPWPYPQIAEPNQSMYYQALRIAARLWDEPRYEAAARALPTPRDDYLWIDLVLPARHDVPPDASWKPEGDTP